MRKQDSLKFRLILIIIFITVVSTTLVAHFASRYSREQIQYDQSTLLREVVNNMASRLGQDMNTRAGEILFLTRMDTMRDATAAAAQKQKLFEDMRAAYPYYAWIGVTDAQGTILAGTDGLLVGKNVGKREWFQQGAKGLHFGDAHDAFLLAKLMPKPKWDDLPLRLVDVSAPVLDDAGKLLGVICGHLSLDWAFEAREALLDNIEEQGIDLVVLNELGKVLMGTPRLPSLQVDLSNLNSWEVLSQGGELAQVEPWPDGVRYLTVAAKESTYKSYSGMGWSLIARKAESQAYAPAKRISNTILLIGLVSALLLAIFIWYYINRQLKPLEVISAAAARIRDGDFKATIPEPQGRDEIAIFSRSLSEMVSSLLEKNEQLRLSERLFEESAQGVVITDNKGRILRVNRAFSQITHYAEEEVLGSSPALLASGHHDKKFYDTMWDKVNRGGTWRGEIWNRNKEGELYPEWLTISALRGEDGAITHYIGLFTDITEKKAQEEQLRQMANYDRLTGLPNRNLLQEHIQGAIDQSVVAEGEFSLLFIDLDKFKNINDTMGHPAGDLILKEVASRFLSRTKEHCTLARWGGDEFVLVIPGGDLIQATMAAKRVIESMGRPFELGGALYHLSASVGIAHYPTDSTSVEGLLRCADTAMYKAKQQGENNYQLYESAMNSSVERFLLIDNAMRLALRAGAEGFSLVYQPQFDLEGETVVGAEVLVRWHHPELGNLSPAEFIPIAEDSKQINDLGRWILNVALRQFREYLDAGLATITLSINCSPHQLVDEKFVSIVEEAAHAHAIPSRLIRLEVTESAIMSDERRVIDVLGRLRDLGYTISIDDFGTGFSCLHYIQKLHPNEIKIDKSFVQTCDTDEDSRNIIKFTVGLAHSMGMEVVAEGVETTQQLALLRENGDVTIQGYLYSRPMAFADFSRFMSSKA
jgi:diguanylate cyclase (GGDEF)-like protein/PAS domain S-box-containing protein